MSFSATEIATPLTTTMATIAELQSLVQTSIKPWKNSSAKPPFSDATLVTMALVEYARPARCWTIYEWVCENLGYYKTAPRTQSDKVLQGLRCYEAPTYETAGLEFTVIWDEARAYLRHILQPEINVFTRFLELPAELRTEIYRLVLQYPSSGLCISSSADDRRDAFQSTTATKDPSEPYSPGVCNRECFTLSLSEALNLLLVNKQVFNETMPMFYSSNLFCFDNFYDTFIVLHHLPKSSSSIH